ncbi:lymphocyte antigen 75-like [Mya arenaria]|uniref:lymphocyte antigen 75-like n=1 Tax=Mya arenaria TaxID=6604 RepID=UPI0022E0FDE7|nr:lymphocyte antigen 75-like [Mya arenaria]
MSDGVDVSVAYKGGDGDVATDFKPATEKHDAGKESRRPKPRQKGPGLLKGKAVDAEYLSWSERNRRLIVIMVIAAVVVVVIGIAIVLGITLSGSSDDSEGAKGKQTGAAVCPEVMDKEDTTFEHNGHCYHVVELTETQVVYDQAQGDCTSRGGHLLTIPDNKTQTFVAENLQDRSESHTILLGLKKEGATWKWVTGVEATFFNWEPSVKVEGNCATLRLDRMNYWEKYTCTPTDWYTTYVCEYPPASGVTRLQSVSSTFVFNIILVTILSSCGVL